MNWPAFADLLGLNPYHPQDWPLEGRRAVDEFRVAQFRARWRWLITKDYPALVRQQSGRRYLIRMVREEVERAVAPLPVRPYRACPCHRARGGMGDKKQDPWLAVRQPGERTALAAARWLGTTFSGKD